MNKIIIYQKENNEIRKATTEEIEDIALEVLNYLYKEIDDYRKGKLDAYLRILGKSQGLNSFLYEEYRRGVKGFLENQVEYTEN